MRILVFSDSHSALSFMRQCVSAIRPDAIVHLGDHYDDGEVIREENPQVIFRQVPGNCDRYRVPHFVQEILIDRLFGVDFYMTHGHKHYVKTGTGALLSAARTSGCAAVLYGHTHIAECMQQEDGLWVMNPGSCGYGGGTAGLIEVNDKKITSCRLIGWRDLEDTI